MDLSGYSCFHWENVLSCTSAHLVLLKINHKALGDEEVDYFFIIIYLFPCTSGGFVKGISRCWVLLRCLIVKLTAIVLAGRKLCS